MWEIAYYAAIDAVLPVGAGIAARFCVTFGGRRWVLTGWLLFALLTSFWISVMLPSFNNERG